MSPTNATADILLDSPALNSLKRAQLVQLCKRHGVKASGKNVILIGRLRRHAAGMLATPARPGLASDCDDEDEEDNDSDGEGWGRDSGKADVDPDRTIQQRPSEAWEIVMDNSDIVEEQYPGSVQSKTRLGPSGSNQAQMSEFGSTGSSKSKVMQVLANSLGLSRSTSASSNIFASSSNEMDSESLGRTPSLKSLLQSTSSKLGSSSPRKLNIFNSDASMNFGTAVNSPARDSLAARSVPYDAIPPARASQLPHVEPFAFSIATAGDGSITSEDGLDLPVPGVGPLASAGVEADGTGAGGPGTIRLVSTPFGSGRLAQEGLDTEPPALAPLRPAFELVPPTPSNPLKSWPLSPEKAGEERLLYPKLNSEDLETSSSGVPTSPSPTDRKLEPTSDLPGSDLDAKQLLSPPQPSTPFIFGSPNPRHSSSAGDFTNAASSVLAEMNARLGVAGARTLGSDILASGSGAKLSEADVLNYQFGGKDGLNASDAAKSAALGGEGSVSSHFNAMHQRAFNKMEGIDDYAARRTAGAGKEKQEEKAALAPLPENRKRKSYQPAGTANKRRSTQVGATKYASGTVGAAKTTKAGGMPGAFGDEEDADEVSANTSKDESIPEREAKRACVETNDGAGQTKRISIAPNGGARRETKTQAQSEADRRHLALMKARRRSSRARIGVVPAPPAQKPKGRLGFLASAKSFVKSVWNHGAGNPSAVKNKPAAAASAAGPSSKPIEAPTAKPPKPPVPEAKKPVFPRQTSLMARKVSGKNEPTGASGKTVVSATGTKAEAKAPASANVTDNPTARKPSTSSITTGNAARSRLCAPTASSLAKMSEAARNKLNAAPSGAAAKAGNAKTRASAAVPARTPTITPLMPRKKNHSIAAGATTSKPTSPTSESKPGIFSSPLVLPTSPQARKAAEQGQSVNAITGAIVAAPAPDAGGMPSLMAMADSLLTEVQEQDEVEGGLEEERDDASVQDDHGHDELGERGPGQDKDEQIPSLMRKPRISRSKIIAKLGAQRERVESSAGTEGSARPPLRPGAGAANVNANANRAGNASAGSKAQIPPAKKSLPAKTTGVRGTKTRVSAMTVTSPKGAARVRKSTAAATASSTAARRSVGAAKAHASGAGTNNAVLLSAKKRVRESEYARRQSTRVSVAAQPEFGGQQIGADDDDMDIDE